MGAPPYKGPVPSPNPPPGHDEIINAPPVELPDGPPDKPPGNPDPGPPEKETT